VGNDVEVVVPPFLLAQVGDVPGEDEEFLLGLIGDSPGELVGVERLDLGAQGVGVGEGRFGERGA
jgi:hypothetical protein